MINTDTRDYTETENTIFHAAIAVFAEKGKEGARMQEIADAAGINKALVHYYFRSKDKLYEEVFSFLIRTHFRLLAVAVEETPNFASQLRRFINTYMDILEQHPVLVPFLTRELAEGAPVMRERFAGMASDPDFPPRVFMRAVDRAARKKNIVRVDAAQLFITLLGSCIYFVQARPMLAAVAPKLGADPERFARQRREHLFELVYYGLLPRAEENT